MLHLGRKFVRYWEDLHGQAMRWRTRQTVLSFFDSPNLLGESVPWQPNAVAVFYSTFCSTPCAKVSDAPPYAVVDVGEDLHARSRIFR
jgi:hypothetical protein